MAKVDSNGRVVLPQRGRERLRITPGIEVEIRERDGKAVVEPEDDPEDIVADLEGLVESAAADREQTASDDLDAQSKDHVETIRRQAISEIVEAETELSGTTAPRRARTVGQWLATLPEVKTSGSGSTEEYRLVRGELDDC